MVRSGPVKLASGVTGSATVTTAVCRSFSVAGIVPVLFSSAISFQYHETNLAFPRFSSVDRPLTHINKKGRPVSQCSHCRGLRKSRTTHVKCECGDKKKKTDSSDSHGDKRDLKREHILLWRCRSRFPHSDLNLQRTPFTAAAVPMASAASVR